MENKDVKYLLFVKWMALPLETKEKNNLPLNNKQFMDKYNISYNELQEFVDAETFSEDLERETIRWGKRQLPEILHSVYKKFLETKKPEHARLFKDLLNASKVEEKEKANSNINQFNFFNVDEEKRREITERMARRAGLLPGGSE